MSKWIVAFGIAVVIVALIGPYITLGIAYLEHAFYASIDAAEQLLGGDPYGDE